MGNTQRGSGVIKGDIAVGQVNKSQFIAWLQESIERGAIEVGADDSPVHIVRDGLFLITPTTFKLFDADQWFRAQHEFLSLKLHERCSVDQGNFHGRHIRGRSNGLLTVSSHKVGIIIPFHNVERLLPQYSTHLFDQEIM
jgi:hypothetical protein